MKLFQLIKFPAIQKRAFLGLLVFPLLLSLGGCSGSDAGGELKEVVVNNAGAKMSAKPLVGGILTASSFYQAIQTASGVSIQSDGPSTAAYSAQLNNMSASGGMPNSATQIQAYLNFAASVASKAITDETAKPLNDPTRLFASMDFTQAFTSGTGADTFNLTVQKKFARDLVLNITGVPATDPEVTSLVQTMQALRLLMANTVGDKILLGKLMATTVVTTLLLHY